ncbi:MAG: hypothetical protein M1813_006492 [Trichoglossum hirsutum]|nr:MAG: hypothetical protein M1813_006492 [Trichoglossum hirsutum]
MASNMHLRALDGYEKVLEKERLSNFKRRSNLASVLGNRSKYEMTGEVHRRALDEHEMVLGKKHPPNFMSTDNLASKLDGQGSYRAAEEMHGLALGKNPTETLADMNNLALVLGSQGNYEAAKKMHGLALELGEMVLGKEHSETLASMNNLASVLGSQGKYKMAEEMHRRALDGYKKVLGKEHPSTLTSMNNLASVLGSQGKYEIAEKMHRRALYGYEKVLGKDHPSTLASMNNLASVLCNQGKYETAEKMHRQALKRYKKVLGRKHPSTLTSMSNLASVLGSQGKYRIAEEMHRRALYGYKEVLGEEHPSTLTSMRNLELVLGSQGKYETAKEMKRWSRGIQEEKDQIVADEDVNFIHTPPTGRLEAPPGIGRSASPPLDVITGMTPQHSPRRFLETQLGEDIDSGTCLFQSEGPPPSSQEADSVNSFEYDSSNNNSEDEGGDAAVDVWSLSEGLSSKNMLSLLCPLFASLPSEATQSLISSLTFLFDSWTAIGISERPAHPSTSSSSATQLSISPGNSFGQASSNYSGGRRLISDGSDPLRDGDEDDGNQKRLKLDPKCQGNMGRGWACPFYQRSPHRYCVETEYGDFRKCAKSPGFREVHRIKYREDELKAHRRDPSPCDVRDPRPMEGLSYEQKNLLRPRDRKNKSEEERWNTIYKICFPNDEFIPSPYFICYSRELVDLRRDVFAIVEEEIGTIDSIIGDHLRRRLQDAFDNTQIRSGLVRPALRTPSSSEVGSQQSPTADPLPLATGSATEITEQAGTAVEPLLTPMMEDSIYGQYVEMENDDDLVPLDLNFR